MGGDNPGEGCGGSGWLRSLGTPESQQCHPLSPSLPALTCPRAPEGGEGTWDKAGIAAVGMSRAEPPGLPPIMGWN